jgi:hypothetical protein
LFFFRDSRAVAIGRRCAVLERGVQIDAAAEPDRTSGHMHCFNAAFHATDQGIP